MCSLKSKSTRLDFCVASLGTHETAVSQGPSMGGCEFYGDTTRFGLCGTHSLDHPGHKGRERIKADPRTGKGCIVSQTHMRFMRMLAWGLTQQDRPVVENNERDSQDRRLLYRPTFPSLDRSHHVLCRLARQFNIPSSSLTRKRTCLLCCIDVRARACLYLGKGCSWPRR